MANRATIIGKLARVLAGTLWCVSVAAASPAGSGRQLTPQPSETVPFPVRVVDYGNLSAPLTIVFRYTALVNGAAGEAEILPGPTKWKINAAFTNLPPASRLGSEYLTYVLWCITPEGRSINLGEVTLTGTDGHLDAKLNLQHFGLIVTAEPYLAVSRPNKAVAFEADVASGSSATLPVSQVNCELLSLPIGAGAAQADPPRTKDPDEPLVIEEARRAIAVARAAGAEEYAPDTFTTAQRLLRLAQDQRERGEKKKDVVDTGSEAVFFAEDARVLAITRQKRAREDRTAACHQIPP